MHPDPTKPIGQDPFVMSIVKREVEAWADRNGFSLHKETYGRKKYTLTCRKLPGDAGPQEELRQCLEESLHHAGVDCRVLRSKNSVEVASLRAEKMRAFAAFVHQVNNHLPAMELTAEEVVTIGDKAEPGGVDFAIVNRPQGFSVAELANSAGHSIPDATGLRGWHAAEWLFTRLRFTQIETQRPSTTAKEKHNEHR